MPSAHMEALYKEAGGAKNSKVTWVDFPDAHHNDTYEIASVRYWPAILAFFPAARAPAWRRCCWRRDSRTVVCRQEGGVRLI